MVVFFHDIVYDSKSNTNEEDSAKLFMELFNHDNSDKVNIAKIYDYILQTKLHDVANSEDEDLKLFVDV